MLSDARLVTVWGSYRTKEGRKKERKTLIKFKVSHFFARDLSMCTASWQDKHAQGKMTVAAWLREVVPVENPDFAYLFPTKSLLAPLK